MEETTAGTKLYDFAKEIVKRQKIISEERLERCMTKISGVAIHCSYLLLMCPDNRQFVFFVVPNIEYYGYTELTNIIKNDLLTILQARGQILDIDMSNHGKRVWEIWIKDKYDGNTYVYQLCDYTEQTVVFGEED